MEFGAHLPLIDMGGGAPTLADLREYAHTAAALDFRYLCANDHCCSRGRGSTGRPRSRPCSTPRAA